MAELGLFPLKVVLLPTEQIPLHIFEPRYKELIGECIEDDAEFGLVLSDDEGLRRVGTRARVTDVLERFDDGRLNVVVEGGERFRLVELTSGRAFHTGQIEPIEDEDLDAEPADAQRALGLFRRVAELAEAETTEPEPSRRLSYEIAARIELPLGLKQELLESQSEPERLRRLSQALDGIAELLTKQKELRDLSSRNGHKRL
jgi:ATP-dependent Lon protease